MKHTKQYNWEFDRINSKGEAKFKHKTGESMEDVEKFLDDKNIRYLVREGAKMYWVYSHEEKFAYYYTTGRWSPFIVGGMPTKHYRAVDIEDFYDRFLSKTIAEEEENLEDGELNRRYIKDKEYYCEAV